MRVGRLGLKFIVIYLIGVHAFVLVLVVKTNFLLLAGKTFGWVPPEEWTEDITGRLLASARRDHLAAAATVVLMGDSIIEQLDAHLITFDAVNLGISGNTVRNLLRQLPVFRSIEQTSNIVLGIGVNDLKYRPVASISRDYAELLKQLPMSPRVTLVGVLPVNEKMPAARERRYLRNMNISVLNGELRHLCASQGNCHFLDTWPAMMNEREGGLRPILAGVDGWHLSRAGNEMLAALIRESLNSLDH